jgi:hypothetical protein
LRQSGVIGQKICRSAEFVVHLSLSKITWSQFPLEVEAVLQFD